MFGLRPVLRIERRLGPRKIGPHQFLGRHDVAAQPISLRALLTLQSLQALRNCRGATIELVRLSLGFRELSGLALLVFAAILIPVSIAVFGWALRRTKITGTLTHI